MHSSGLSAGQSWVKWLLDLFSLFAARQQHLAGFSTLRVGVVEAPAPCGCGCGSGCGSEAGV